MNLIDISMKIEEEMPVYPDNPQPKIRRYRQIPEDSTTESEIEIGSHTGTHVDAPLHVFEDGKPVSKIDLEKFYGKCRVLDLGDAGKAVKAEDLDEDKLDSRIVLLKTENSEKKREKFRKDFAHLTLEAAEKLAENGVETVGIDYLSLVAFEGREKAKKAHEFANMEMTVIEGLRLNFVEPGNYTFSGFPLKMDTDGAPMRAVLIEE